MTFTAGNIISEASLLKDIIAIHVQYPSPRPVVKCFDAKVLKGKLKLTLFATNKSTPDYISFEHHHEDISHYVITKLRFCGSYYLVGLCSSTSFSSNVKAIVWDLNRGVVSHTLIPSFSSMTLCDIACTLIPLESYVYAIYCDKSIKKLIINIHDLENDDARVIKSIKDIGSVPVCQKDKGKQLFQIGIGLYNKKEQVRDEGKIIIRNGKKIRIIDINTGALLLKLKVESSTSYDNDLYFSSLQRPLLVDFSDDGNSFYTESAKGIRLFPSCRDCVELPFKSKVDTVLCVTTSTSSVSREQSTENYLITCIISDGKLQIYQTYFSSNQALNIDKRENVCHKNLSFLSPISTITCVESNSPLVLAYFLSSDIYYDNEGATCLAVISYDKLESITFYEKVIFRDNKLTLVGNIMIRQEEGIRFINDATNEKNKRKASSKNILLGPGETGREILTLIDQLQNVSKLPRVSRCIQNEKSKLSFDKRECAILNVEGLEGIEGIQDQTIAEHLAIISAELSRKENQELEDEDDINNMIKLSISEFDILNPTSDSLVTLLRQALLSNDDVKLEMVLQVSDKNIIDNSITSLANSNEVIENDCPDIIITLLSKLVFRFARKPTRASQLSYWISKVILILISPPREFHDTGEKNRDRWKMEKVQREVAMRMGPLKHLLEERVQCLPDLLKLEGRLSLLSSHL